MGRNKKRSSRGGRGRIQTAGDALEQLLGLEHAQQMRRKKRTKQIIDSKDKSDRRFANQLRLLNGTSIEDVKNAFE